ncbi:histidine kinase [Echinicola sp. CAU 1574]|uniref:histidine kinase n=1 Tax=Echinicola arenosa TaxID=2774144 RepID=A0ABR9AJQ8_9BACT|nr:ATP-binding protein [Echinicola arenosa]MBD8488769.1 histidine kinase [Echinicola arenosa]
MSSDPAQFVFLITSGVLITLVMCGFIVAMVLFHRQQQIRNRQKMDHMKAEYERTILGVEKEIQEQTLSFIGQELHDNVGQILSLTKLTLNNPDPENFSEGKRLINQAIKEVRTLSKRLNLDWVKEVKLLDFIQQELQKIENSGFCQTQFDSNITELELEKDQKLVLIRIIQECLNNTMKHAEPKLITVSLQQKNDFLELMIKDDGKGFDVEDKSKGMGLHNLKSRIETIGGNLQLFSKINMGTEIKLLLPFA